MDNHLTNIEIKDFKCFKDFQADGFKRVNLIGGKNNVGKTAFMEACYVNVSSRNIDIAWTALSSLYLSRNNLEYLGKELTREHIIDTLEFNEEFNTVSNINKVIFLLLNKDGKKEYIFELNDKKTIINSNDFSYNVKSNLIVSFIDNFGLTNNNLKDSFEAVQKKDKEEILYNYINEFDDNIINFKIIGGDKPQCKIANGEYRNINEFGDGLKHYISIICSLYSCTNGYLFIDEIDNGIHWTQLDRLWNIILTISKEQNVQVFATTHSKECIESYARVSKKLEDEDIAFIELGKNKKNELDSIVMDSEMFLRHIKIGNEVRGW